MVWHHVIFILDREPIVNGSNNKIRNPVLNRKLNNGEQGDLTYDDRVTRYQQALGDSHIRVTANILLATFYNLLLQCIFLVYSNSREPFKTSRTSNEPQFNQLSQWDVSHQRENSSYSNSEILQRATQFLPWCLRSASRWEQPLPSNG